MPNVLGVDVPGKATALTLANSTIEMAAVGPQIKCNDEPHKHAIITGTMAAYSPYSGGKPAIKA